jgi:hypothetical protein
MLKRAKAAALNARGLKLQKQERWGEAIRTFEKAVAVDPGWSVPLYNLGLLYKCRRNWEKSLEYNRRAAQMGGKKDPAWWNLGIAATALGRWDVARKAWRGFGIDLPDGDGPPSLSCGFGPIRINPDGDAEVVWAERIDPARAVLVSIPFPESGHRWKDTVLNDGAPTGYRKYGGKDIPVFDELALLQPSAFGTYVVRVRIPPGRENVEKLAEAATELDGGAEDWSTSVRMICKACSEGRPHQEHDTKAAPPDGIHVVGIAARDESHALRILAKWKAAVDDIHVEGLEAALEACVAKDI